MSKKDIVIIGSFPSNENGKRILKDSLLSLAGQESFDIILSTHFPADKETQGLVKYYIYDQDNSFVKTDSFHFVRDGNIYYQKGSFNHHSYAVYRLIMNALFLLRNQYDNFYYIEGDCEWTEEDLQKMKALSQKTSDKGKLSWFFMDRNWTEYISTVCFYSNIEFFLKNIPYLLTDIEYVNYCSSISADTILEKFFKKQFQESLSLNEINIVDNTVPGYFNNGSIFNLTSVVDQGVIGLSSENYILNVVRNINTNNLTVFFRSNQKILKEDIFIYFDGDVIAQLSGDNYMFWSDIFPKKDSFEISSSNGFKKTYSKYKILNDEGSYISFENL